MEPEKDHLRFYTFKGLKLRQPHDNPPGIAWNLCVEHLVRIIMTLSARVSDVFKPARNTPEISHSLEHQSIQSFKKKIRPVNHFGYIRAKHN